MKRFRGLVILVAACAIASIAISASASSNPYARIPAKGDNVRFDGSVGGEQFAWGFYQEYWLQTYLRFTIEAARNPAVYAKSKNALAEIGNHALNLNNGTRGVAEEVKTFNYGGHIDVQVRVLVQDSDLHGSEVWTTAGELVDNSGRTYLKP
jgi:hypothetical protein